MNAISYSQARANFSDTLDSVCKNHEPIIITRRNAEATVIMSLEDYNSIEETAYLLKSPANAKKLRESIEQAESGKLFKKDIIEK